MNMMKGYHDFTENEMLLLGDVFEKIRHSSFKCYFSEPDLSWDTISYMTKFRVERISDADMYLFFEKDMINRLYLFPRDRNSKANSNNLNHYNPKQEPKHILPDYIKWQY